MPRSLLPLALTLLCLCALAATASAQFIFNNSFEAGPDPGASLELPHGSQAIVGWTVTGDAVTYGGTAWAAGEGSRSVGLYTAQTSATTSAITARFASLAASLFEVLFLYAPAPLNGPATDRSLIVRVNGQAQTFTMTGVGTPTDPGWRLGTLGFTAVGDSTTLEFANDQDPQHGGVLVDAVRVIGGDPTMRESWGHLRARFR